MSEAESDKAARVLADFEGRWRMARRIGQANGPDARLEGEACWSPVAEGLLCEERGVLSVEGQLPLAAHRRYLWRSDLSVWFDDGRYFHQVPGQGGPCGHWCDPDQYDGVYDFSRWPVWRCTWQVRGPRKDYRMVTEYRR
ncbi:DUF6314 family protein [Roseovarius sp. PS-C2]|uniref:DUF6314 family protein n=1 Tax=Roseovarius sp. PS-C2 TaxID=2820814 RepID=UPI00263AEE7D|nr:DUF6314 family protein [Roseovarius sp. PS-C2]